MNAADKTKLKALNDLFDTQRANEMASTVNDLIRFVNVEGECLTESKRQDFYWLLHRLQDFTDNVAKAENLTRFWNGQQESN